MRIVFKGGVWKNSEDEVLKAAIMKYGLNQWARVASLLPRKTAATCKARWFEWLDPSIKKTEWTRDEEERLLHLAKLMPSQWRTIAPLVGRTAAQCIEHYERLLDAAAAATSGAGSSSSSSSSSAAAADDPRRLRPGEIDPMPEIKPARPDPVDMDEDEKEMLSEARARLANTKGKKAKRKARERMLDEARQLATLQKARELKAAGIVQRARPRKRTDGIDYATEVPFERRAPAGFYDTAAEDVRFAVAKARETDQFKATLLNKIEAQRAGEEEAHARAQDKRVIKQMESRNLPAMLMAEAAADPMNVRKRPRLALPAPTIAEGELEEVARIGAAAGAGGYADALVADDDGAASSATRGLMTEYAAPRSVAASLSMLGRSADAARAGGAASREAVLEEARNQLAMRAEASSLLGGESAQLEAGTGYSGVAPRGGAVRGATGRTEAGGGVFGATPALRAGFGGGGGGGGGGIGGSGASVAGGASVATGMGGGSSVVIRDAMGINRGGGDAMSAFGDSASVFGGSSFSVAGRDAGAELSASVALSLRSLPKPKGEYELVAPEVDDDDADEGAGAGVGGRRGAAELASAGSSAYVPDAAEADSRRAQREAAERERALARRSAVLRHDPELPRPVVLDDDAIAPPVGPGAGPLAIAEGLVFDEMLALLKADAINYPVNHRFFKPPKRMPVLAQLSDAQLAEARKLVEDELTNVRIAAENAHGVEIEPGTEAFSAAFADACQAARDETVYLPSSRRLVERVEALAAPALRAEYAAALRQRFEDLAKVHEREAQRLQKAEARAGVLTRGFEARAAAAAARAGEAFDLARDREIDAACFERLAAQEQAALAARLAAAQEDCQREAEREKELQARYADVCAAIAQIEDARDARMSK